MLPTLHSLFCTSAFDLSLLPFALLYLSVSYFSDLLTNILILTSLEAATLSSKVPPADFISVLCLESLLRLTIASGHTVASTIFLT